MDSTTRDSLECIICFSMFTAFGFVSVDHGGGVSEVEQYLLTITTSFEYSKPCICSRKFV